MPLSSRERNRIHARKTRQRKKEQMQNLQSRADELKEEQIRLKQLINEKSTASILVGLFLHHPTTPMVEKEGVEGEQQHRRPQQLGELQTTIETAALVDDARVEELLRRPVEQIPDASTIPELPALILPGHHASRRIRANSASYSGNANEDSSSSSCCVGHTTTTTTTTTSNDNFDYDLLGKDRSTCSPDELDRIRRERNRMHAKRTRDRKRLFTEQMSEICRELEEENHLLHLHLATIDPDYNYAPPPPELSETQGLPIPTRHPTKLMRQLGHVSDSPSTCPSTISQQNDLSTLLQAVDAFERPTSLSQSTIPPKQEGARSVLTESLLCVARKLAVMNEESSASHDETAGSSRGDDEDGDHDMDDHGHHFHRQDSRSQLTKRRRVSETPASIVQLLTHHTPAALAGVPRSTTSTATMAVD